jgi:hypothetical protein
MTRVMGNMGIIRQIEHFLKVLIIWRVGVGVLKVCGAQHKMGGNLG